ncbi:glucose/mannose transport system permease protein [Rhizobium sp. BK313]|jgi:glucose/mannose transport system permease protein|uniref:carbohydrate ABC transporter permease n=1 Tax=Rhizobium sp. BK313 TaxID=2587081 RepID=UPI00105B2808|nr:sugar ABC transporter permease [Rhizobium sp. BK313]MBB3452966.1 glucose/mannose transport system permease protein [Rhizobium sp. BK313]
MARAVRPFGLFRNLSAKIAAIPMVLTVIVVFVGCTLWTVIYSFTDSKSLPSTRFVGLAQYQRLWTTDRWNISIGNLATYGILMLIFAFVVGFFLAVLMDQKIRFENTFRTIFLYPFALSFIVTGLVWQWILDPSLGLPKLLQDMGFAGANFALLGNQETVIYALVIAGLWQGTGLVMVLMLAGLRGIDGEIWKASRVDGIPAWRTYIFVVIPMMRGVFVTTLVIIASGIVRVYDLVVATTNGGPGFASEMPAKYVYDFMFQRGNLGQALSASTVMLVTVFIFVVPWALVEFRQKRR